MVNGCGNCQPFWSFHRLLPKIPALEPKERILRVADEVCRKIGFRAMTMDDLAEKLSISKKTLYQYFEDKEALVDAIIDNEINSTRHDCAICNEIAVDAVDEIFLTLEMMMQDCKDLNPLIIHDLQKYFPEIAQKFIEAKNKFFYDIIYNNLKRGIKEGLYRKEINIDILTRYRLETSLISFNQDVFPSDKYNLTAVTKEILEHFMYGIVTEKGHELILKYKKSKNKQK